MKPSSTRAFDSIANCSIAALKDRTGTLNTSTSKGISLFSTQKSALHSAGSLFARKPFHSNSPSKEKEDYSACALRKAEQTLLRL